MMMQAVRNPHHQLQSRSPTGDLPGFKVFGAAANRDRSRSAAPPARSSGGAVPLDMNFGGPSGPMAAASHGEAQLVHAGQPAGDPLAQQLTPIQLPPTSTSAAAPTSTSTATAATTSAPGGGSFVGAGAPADSPEDGPFVGDGSPADAQSGGEAGLRDAAKAFESEMAASAAASGSHLGAGVMKRPAGRAGRAGGGRGGCGSGRAGGGGRGAATAGASPQAKPSPKVTPSSNAKPSPVGSATAIVEIGPGGKGVTHSCACLQAGDVRWLSG